MYSSVDFAFIYFNYSPFILMSQIQRELGVAAQTAYLTGSWESWETATGSSRNPGRSPRRRSHRQQHCLHMGKISLFGSYLIDVWLDKLCLYLSVCMYEFITLPQGIILNIVFVFSIEKLWIASNLMITFILLCYYIPPLCFLLWLL